MVNLGSNDSLDLCVLSKKTSYFVSSYISIKSIRASFDTIKADEKAVKFSLAKAQHSGSLKTLTLRRFTNPLLCPVLCLVQYLDCTNFLRNISNKDVLFICVNKPNKPAKSSTIGGWIKSFLLEAGIDPVFSVHSTRGAADSKADSLGFFNTVHFASGQLEKRIHFQCRSWSGRIYFESLGIGMITR